MLLSQNVPNLINGVSQQAESVRFPSQCVAQENFYPTVLRGLSKRPSTHHVAQLTAAPDNDILSGNYVTHRIDRSPTERFIAVIGNGGLKVFDLAGNEQSIEAPEGFSYLACSDPSKEIRALTVADYTFLVNTTKTVLSAASPSASPARNEALVMVKQVRDGADYTIRLFNSPASTTPDYTLQVLNVRLGNASTNAGPTVHDQGGVIAQLNQVFGASAADALYNHFIEGELLYVEKKDGSNFRVEVDCTVSEGMAVFKDSVQSFSLLPKKGWAGFHIKVKGNPEDAGDDYYLKFVPQASAAIGFSEGTWEEAQQPALTDDAIVRASMPHSLVNLGGGNFYFAPVDWVERKVGDTLTNPVPSFVGGKIADVFFHKNRLGLLSGGNVILSEAGQFFNFWRTTVIQLLDSDPIDVAAENDIGVFRSAVASSEKLLVFSNSAQAVLDGGDLLTPKSASLKQTSALQSTAHVRPIPLGSSVFFPFSRGAFTGFMDYAVAPDTGLFDGFEITEHVPAYIAGEVRAVTASDTAGALVIRVPEQPVLYVYKFFKQGQRRVQSSWFTFRVNGDIRGAEFFDSRLYLLVLRSAVPSADRRLCLEYIDLSPGLEDTDSGGNAAFPVHLDRRTTGVGSPSYNPALEETTFTLPYKPSNSANVRVVRRSSAAYGTALQIKSVSDSTVKVHGNHASSAVWMGEVYRSEQELTRPALRVRGADGEMVVSEGRFQIRNGLVTLDDSLDLTVEVTPQGRPTFTYGFAARVLGTSLAVSGSALKPRSAPFRFPVYSKNDQVVIKFINESYLPCNLLSLDWEALYTVRSRRV